MLGKVITGGQTGVDQAALRAAQGVGIPTGGWAPKGWETEDGPAPWLAEYGLQECPTPGYPARTKLNVQNAHALLWFGNPRSPGGRLTLSLAIAIPVMVVTDTVSFLDVFAWLEGMPGHADGMVLMVAGNRESKAWGIGKAAQDFLSAVFKCHPAPPAHTAPRPPGQSSSPKPDASPH